MTDRIRYTPDELRAVAEQLPKEAAIVETPPPGRAAIHKDLADVRRVYQPMRVEDVERMLMSGRGRGGMMDRGGGKFDGYESGRSRRNRDKETFDDGMAYELKQSEMKRQNLENEIQLEGMAIERLREENVRQRKLEEEQRQKEIAKPLNEIDAQFLEYDDVPQAEVAPQGGGGRSRFFQNQPPASGHQQQQQRQPQAAPSQPAFHDPAIAGMAAPSRIVNMPPQPTGVSSQGPSPALQTLMSKAKVGVPTIGGGAGSGAPSALDASVIENQLMRSNQQQQQQPPQQQQQHQTVLRSPVTTPPHASPDLGPQVHVHGVPPQQRPTPQYMYQQQQHQPQQQPQQQPVFVQQGVPAPQYGAAGGVGAQAQGNIQAQLLAQQLAMMSPAQQQQFVQQHLRPGQQPQQQQQVNTHQQMQMQAAIIQQQLLQQQQQQLPR